VRDHARRIRIPAGEVDDGLEVGDLVPVLDVDREGVHRRGHRGGPNTRPRRPTTAFRSAHLMARALRAGRKRPPGRYRGARAAMAGGKKPRPAAARTDRPRPAAQAVPQPRAAEPTDWVVPALAVVFALSGSAGLVHEVVWTRLLSHVFGA